MPSTEALEALEASQKSAMESRQLASEAAIIKTKMRKMRESNGFSELIAEIYKP